MTSFGRRTFLAGAAASWAAGPLLADAATHRGDLRLAPFRFDVTPPLGHSCCGGWIKPVEAVDDRLEAIGFVLLGAGKPIVLCAVDWTGLLNRAHIQWRNALAEAAETTPDRVAVQCVHQHNAPFACLDAQEIVSQYEELPAIVDVDFFQRCLDAGRTAVKNALPKAQPVTHLQVGEAKVEKVASNRRVMRDEQRRIVRMRGSSCRDEELRALPEGLIDPLVKTVAFCNKDRRLAACHYYATHPMSYYADGRVSSDFAGLARKRLQAEQPETTHIYFTGCSGNIAAGKYNDGSKPVRKLLTDRLFAGLRRAESKLRDVELKNVSWQTVDLVPTPRATYSAEAIARQIADPNQRVVNRNRPSYTLAWLKRMEKGTPILLSALRLGEASLLHLPAECFVQYQLAAQSTAPEQFVATAAYGDGGPWYIPVADEYACGGYEVSVAFCEPTIEAALKSGVNKLLLG